MTIYTSGDTQNSYVALDEANAILLTLGASFLDGSEELTSLDERYLIEAADDLNTLWRWTGLVADLSQQMQWPRKYVPKPGWYVPPEPGWRIPDYGYEEQIMYKINYLSGNSAAYQFIDNTTVPKQIKEAQVLIAVLRKKGSNLVGDNQGDAQGMQLGPVKIAYVNAIRESADIHKRCAPFGMFIGDGIMRTPTNG